MTDECTVVSRRDQRAAAERLDKRIRLVASPRRCSAVGHDGRTCKAPHPNYTERHIVMEPDAEGSLVPRVEVTNTVPCTRLADHDGDHAGYVFSIRTPETWPNTPEDKEDDRSTF
jgi:hypothetical protein